jgi:phage terminase large subunit GpA-like protein
MDAVSDPAVGVVVVKSSAQVGKSEVLLNVIGFHIQHDPAPILGLQPTLEMAEAFAKDRLAHMLRDSPGLSGLVADPRSRDSGNTILHKQFPGGHITLAGANSPSSLASRPVRVVLCDEVDRYPPSAGAEGDPVSLAVARTKTFWNRKVILTSTPTIKSGSRIDAAYRESDQRRFYVPCPHCSNIQPLEWERVKFSEDEPEKAAYACAECGALWADGERVAAVSRGEWRAHAPFNGVAGFHINELYSPWVSVADTARAYVDARRSGSAERMRAFTNVSLGEVYEDEGEHPEEGSLMARGEKWEAMPDGVLLTTIGVDVQGDRLEYELVGWGVDEESWSLEYGVIRGDPGGAEVWKDLGELIAERKPAAACVDSGGLHTQQVYAFCRQYAKARVYAVKGSAGAGRTVWPRQVTKGRRGARLFVIGVDAAKDTIYSRLRHERPGPGYCHLPKDREPSWFAGLTSETVVTKYSKGFPSREYKLRPGMRNEPLDCRVYAYAALCSFGRIRWPGLLERRLKESAAKKTETVAKPQESVAKPQEPPPMRRAYAPMRRGNWVNGWRR